MRPAFARFFGRALSQTAPHLALFAVLLLTFASQATSFWQCEGQKCGASSWACCCAAPVISPDAPCDESAKSHYARGEHAEEAGLCALDCHCSMVVQDTGPSVSTAPFALAATPVFALPVRFVPAPEAACLVQVQRFEPSRGPPLRWVHLGSAPHRGPPLA